MKNIFRKLLSLTAAKNIIPFFLGKPGRPLYLSVAVHTEKIQDPVIFEKLAGFGRALPFKPAAFVMTPASPIVAAEMNKTGTTDEAFRARLRNLSDLFEIGLHGHYCRPCADPSGPANEAWLRGAGFELTSGEPNLVREQFKLEYDYLAANGYKSELYCAGWWLLNETVVRLLEEYSFKADCSVRHGCDDTFGARYLRREQLPGKGRAFILPPSKNVAEFPSVTYLHLDWWVLVRDLLPMLFSFKGPLFAVLPVHDYSLPEEGEKVLENIRLLSRIRNVEFVPFSRMPEIAKEEGLT